MNLQPPDFGAGVIKLSYRARPKVIPLLPLPRDQFHRAALAQQNYAYQNMVTSHNAISHVKSVTGILLISIKQKLFKQYFLLKQLYEIETRGGFHKGSPKLGPPL